MIKLLRFGQASCPFISCPFFYKGLQNIWSKRLPVIVWDLTLGKLIRDAHEVAQSEDNFGILHVSTCSICSGYRSSCVPLTLLSPKFLSCSCQGNVV